MRSTESAFRANSAPAGSTALMTLCDSRYGSVFGHRRLTAFCMHTSSDAFVIRKPRWSTERGSPSRNSVAADHRSVHRYVGRYRCNGRTLDADGESTVAHDLDGPLHLQRPDVPICNLARRGATNLYGLWGTHNPPVVGSIPTRPTSCFATSVGRAVDRCRRSGVTSVTSWLAPRADT